VLKRAQVKVEVQVKIERSIETEPTGGAQGGVALAAAGGSGSMPAPDIGGGPDLSDPDHPNHNSWRSDETARGGGRFFELQRACNDASLDE
jgi:hypothetical protein